MSCNCGKKKDLEIKRLSKDAIIPKYETAKAAGMDLAIPEKVVLMPGAKVIVKLGFAVAVPEGCEMQIRPRSGNSAKTDLHISNSPGTIDEDYRGEVGVILENKSDTRHLIFEKGDRVAQAVIGPVYNCNIVEVDELDETVRGDGGFGHTGQ